MKPTNTLAGLVSTALESIRGLLGHTCDSTKVKVGTLQSRLRAVNGGLEEALSLKSAIRDAIDSKTPSIEPTDDLVTWPEAIESIQTGDAPVPEPTDIIFMDYDGTTVKSYTFAQARSLNALPTLPTHEGLTNEGWNYTLAQVKAEANNNRKALIGCTYKTTDNITRIHITIPANSLDFHLNFAQDASRSNNLSWGDGSGDTPGSTQQMTRTHTYSAPGDYTITIQPVSRNTLKLTGPICGDYFTDCDKITAMEFGGVHTVGSRCFTRCTNLTKVSIPKDTALSGRVFEACENIQAFVIPSTVAALPGQFFQYAVNLKLVSFPPSMTEVPEKCFYDCPALEEVRLPMTVTILRNYAFWGCSKLTTVHGYISGQVEWNVFAHCGSLRNIHLPGGDYGSACFYSCKNLRELNSNGVITYLGNNESFFQDGISLQSIGEITAPVIPNKAFYNCVSLKRVKISNCTTIESAAFRNTGLLLLDFTGCTQIPQIQSDTFTNVSPDAVFLVPQSLYNNWIQADVWSNLAQQIKPA